MDAKTQKNVELLMEISEDAEELGAYKTHYQNVQKTGRTHGNGISRRNKDPNNT